MWKCSRCGEKIVDQADNCWNCGTDRDAVGSQDSNARPQVRSDPDLESRPDDEDATDKDDASAASPPDRPLTETGFATVMLRLLGVYFAATGMAGLVAGIGRVLLLANRFGLERALDRYGLDFFVYPIIELIVGIYFLIGGRWVFNKLLTPSHRAADDDYEDDDWEDAENEGTADHPPGDDAGTTRK